MIKKKVIKKAFFIIVFTILSLSVYMGLLVVSVNPLRQILYMIGIFIPAEVHRQVIETPLLNYPGVSHVRVKSFENEDEVPEQTVWIVLDGGDEIVFDEVALHRDPFKNVVQSIGDYGLYVCRFDNEKMKFVYENCTVSQFALFFGYNRRLPNIKKLLDFYPTVRERIKEIPDVFDYRELKKIERKVQMDWLSEVDTSVLDNPFCYECTDGDIYWLYKFPKENLKIDLPK